MRPVRRAPTRKRRLSVRGVAVKASATGRAAAGLTVSVRVSDTALPDASMAVTVRVRARIVAAPNASEDHSTAAAPVLEMASVPPASPAGSVTSVSGGFRHPPVVKLQLIRLSLPPWLDCQSTVAVPSPARASVGQL